MKLANIMGIVAVLTAFPVWAQELAPTELEITTEVALVTESRVQVTPLEYRQLEKISFNLTQGQHDAANALWGEFVIGLAASGKPFDINAIAQFVLREAYIEHAGDLRYYAAKVRYYEELKGSMRREIQRVRAFRAAFATAGADLGTTSTLECLDAILADAEMDGQLATLELQDMLSKKQSVMQTISSMLKMFHDTTKAIINNLKA